MSLKQDIATQYYRFIVKTWNHSVSLIQQSDWPHWGSFPVYQVCNAQTNKIKWPTKEIAFVKQGFCSRALNLHISYPRNFI